MPPFKRKPSTTGLIMDQRQNHSSSFYQLPSSSSSKRRLLTDEDNGATQQQPHFPTASSEHLPQRQYDNVAPIRSNTFAPYQAEDRVESGSSAQVTTLTEPFQSSLKMTTPTSTVPATPLREAHLSPRQHHQEHHYQKLHPQPNIATLHLPQTQHTQYEQHTYSQPHHNQDSPPHNLQSKPRTYLILGASRGIGLEFTRHLLQLSPHNQVIAVVRSMPSASHLWSLTANTPTPNSCIIEQCDTSSPASIDAFIARMKKFVLGGGSIDTVVLNAGILEYERGLGALEVEFGVLEGHLRVNCVGLVVVANRLLRLNDLEEVVGRREREAWEWGNGEGRACVPVVGRQVVFISSDSASMGDFREYEDGFAAYGASKAALNMMIRHMAAELRRRGNDKRRLLQKAWQRDWQAGGKQGNGSEGDGGVQPWEIEVCVLAMHPGEVSTDMANIEIAWDVEGVITPEESVRAMLGVLETKTVENSGQFWRWDATQHPW